MTSNQFWRTIYRDAWGSKRRRVEKYLGVLIESSMHKSALIRLRTSWKRRRVEAQLIKDVRRKSRWAADFSDVPMACSSMCASIIGCEITFIRHLMLKMGFFEVLPDELVTQKDNFDNLNIGPDHPCRNDHDSMFLSRGRMMTSQVTSSHFASKLYLLDQKRIFLIGRAYRNDHDSTHMPSFWQLEWLIKENHYRVEDFIRRISNFLLAYFDRSLEVSVRPSYFPFTYMSFEVDVRMDGRVYEICGAGMMHPGVLRKGGVRGADQKKWPALAFGVERLVMIKYGFGQIKNVNAKYKWY